MNALDDSERRRHPRLILKAFGFQAACRYTAGAAGADAQLIDISPGGARLRTLGKELPDKGQSIVLDAMLPGAPVAMDRLAAKVCWTNAPEFGVAFTPELDLGVSDLQALLDPGD